MILHKEGWGKNTWLLKKIYISLSLILWLLDPRQRINLARFTEYQAELIRQKKEEFRSIAVFPVKMKVLKEHVYMSRYSICLFVLLFSGGGCKKCRMGGKGLISKIVLNKVSYKEFNYTPNWGFVHVPSLSAWIYPPLPVESVWIGYKDLIPASKWSQKVKVPIFSTTAHDILASCGFADIECFWASL